MQFHGRYLFFEIESLKNNRKIKKNFPAILFKPYPDASRRTAQLYCAED